MPIPDGHRRSGARKRGGAIRCFEGVSAFRHTSNAASLHEAIQEAAFVAAGPDGFNLKRSEFKDLEVTRIQVRIGGNPNVKVYRVELTEI